MTRSTVARLAIHLALLGFATLPVGADPVTAISLSVNQFGTANGISREVQWDRNGRFAVFKSDATNLVAGQVTAATPNIFLYDRLTGTSRLVSHIPGNAASTGNLGVDPNRVPVLSADGKWVLYSSPSTNLISGQVDTNNAADIFLWSRETDSTLLVSRAAGSAVTTGNGGALIGSGRPISTDGRYVVFQSVASDVVTGQVPNEFSQLFQFDRISGQSVMVSHAFNLATRSANETSAGSTTSADGRYVAFVSLATNLVNGLSDSNVTADIFLWDRDAPFVSSTRLLSRKQGFPGTTGNGFSNFGLISADGTGVVFVSAATDLEGVTTDTNGQVDLLHYDRPTDVLSLVSHRSDNNAVAANGAVGLIAKSISDDGNSVTFESTSTNHVVSQIDTNAVADIFLWSGPIQLVSHAAGLPTTSAAGASTAPLISGDGTAVAFSSLATNLVSGVSDTNASRDVFQYRRDSGAVTLVSHIPNEVQTGFDESVLESIAVGGAVVAFETESSNIVGDDSNGLQDVFVHSSLVFADGFEGGDFSSWSVHVP